MQWVWGGGLQKDPPPPPPWPQHCACSLHSPEGRGEILDTQNPKLESEDAESSLTTQPQAGCYFFTQNHFVISYILLFLSPHIKTLLVCGGKNQEARGEKLVIYSGLVISHWF